MIKLTLGRKERESPTRVWLLQAEASPAWSRQENTEPSPACLTGQLQQRERSAPGSAGQGRISPESCPCMRLSRARSGALAHKRPQRRCPAFLPGSGGSEPRCPRRRVPAAAGTRVPRPDPPRTRWWPRRATCGMGVRVPAQIPPGEAGRGSAGSRHWPPRERGGSAGEAGGAASAEAAIAPHGPMRPQTSPRGSP